MNRLLSFLMLACIPFFSRAQSLTGTVTDENDDPVIGAIIEVSQYGQKPLQAVSDFDGNYSIPALTDGIYDVVVHYVGYKTTTIHNASIGAHDTSLDVSIFPNQLEEFVVVYCKPLITYCHRTNCFFWEYSAKFFDENNEPWFYPNPTTNVLNLTYKHNVSGQFYITDMAGRLIRTLKGQPEGKSTIDVSDLAAGTYVINYHYDKDKRISGKVVVLH